MPYDLDNNLRPSLEELAAYLEQLDEDTAALLSELDETNERLARQLAKLLEKLQTRQKQYDEEVMQPLDAFEQMLPVMADQSRFLMIVLHQMDLAERLASLKGRRGEDDPRLKTRMRDLEEEQLELRNELSEVLENLLDHAERLSEEPELEQIAEQIRKFVRDVEDGGAQQAMSAAVAALSEFDGARGYEKAQEAADLLADFLDVCEQMNGACRGYMMGIPRIGDCLGNTIAQLLGEMGWGDGAGGYGGGHSSRSGWGRSSGLYGGLPGMDESYRNGFGEGRGRVPSSGHDGHDNGPGGVNPDQSTWNDTEAEQSAGGMGEGMIPVRYRRRIGQYFRRLAEEWQDY